MENLFAIILLLAVCPVSWEDGGVEFRSDGNAIFAVMAKDGKPAWSDDGLLYRERYSPEFEKIGSRLDSSPKSENIEVPMLLRHGRLYVILEKTPISSVRQTGASRSENVLVSLDLRTEGKLVFRRDSLWTASSKFRRFVSLNGDTLTVECEDGSTVSLDVATGYLSR